MSEKSKQRAAIGLLYEGDTPHVSSKGFGNLAEEIIAAANEKGILIHQDVDLARTLEKLEKGEEIPRELYYVIAELIAYSYVLRGKFPPGWDAFSTKLNIKA